MPVCPVATACPAAVRSYFTFALLLDVSVTESTLDDTADASGLAENAVIAAANCEPFSNSCTRLAVGVEELKNASQLVLIAATVAAEPPPRRTRGGRPAADAVVAGAELAAGVELELELLLLEQAVIAAASARLSAGARRIRRPVLRSGMCCASLGRRRFIR